MKYLARMCTCVATLVSVSSAAYAAPILIPVTGSIDGNISIYTDPPTSVADVRGFSTVQVIEFTTVEDLGTGFVLGSDPYPSNVLGLVDSGTTEGVLLTFDFASSTFPTGFPGPQWQVNVFGSALTPTVTLPALIGFLGNDIAQFTLLGDFPNGSPILDAEGLVVGTSYPYRLDFIAGTGEAISAVPEPATLCLVGSGIAFAIRRRSKKGAA